MKILPYLLLFSLLCLLSQSNGGNVTSTGTGTSTNTSTSIVTGKNDTKTNAHDRFAYTMPLKIISFLPKIPKIIKSIHSLWNMLHHGVNEKTYTLELIKQTHLEIKHLEKEVKAYIDNAVVTVLQAFPKVIKLELYLHDLTLIINQINFADEQMRAYFNYKNHHTSKRSISPTRNETIEKDYSHFENMSSTVMDRSIDYRWMMEKYSLIDFATWATGHSFNSLTSLLSRMNDLFVKTGNNGIFDLLLENLKVTGFNLCNFNESPYQTIYNLYNKVAMAELKGNAILQFSYIILRMNEKGDFFAEGIMALEAYQKYSKQKIETVLKALSIADRSYYKCDPKKYVEDVTHTQLTRVVQGYIENEVMLNPGNSCKKKCHDYSFAYQRRCYPSQFCSKQPQCAGPVINCRYIDRKMKVCRSTNPYRRYDWVKYKNRRVLGRKGYCSRWNLYNVKSWRRYLFWHCDYCFCFCDDDGPDSQRHISLRNVTSDIKNNKVVTGVRIVKFNKIIHLQIQEGVLNSQGLVNESSTSWKPVDNFTIYDSNVKRNVDFCKQSWYHRGVNVDEVVAPAKYVVTGVRFQRPESSLDLEIRVTPYNFTTGLLFQDYSYWVKNHYNGVRTKIELDSPDVPTRKGPHFLNSKNNYFIEFQATDMDADAAQTTVPFFDSQPLTSNGFPISGVGLIHRGRSGSGGFLAPKIISYDFARHLNNTDTQ